MIDITLRNLRHMYEQLIAEKGIPSMVGTTNPTRARRRRVNRSALSRVPYLARAATPLLHEPKDWSMRHSDQAAQLAKGLLALHERCEATLSKTGNPMTRNAKGRTTNGKLIATNLVVRPSALDAQREGGGS